jgi:hypothetical protein
LPVSFPNAHLSHSREAGGICVQELTQLASSDEFETRALIVLVFLHRSPYPLSTPIPILMNRTEVIWFNEKSVYASRHCRIGALVEISTNEPV